ncbi:hypothetical protein Q7C_185 [Methylophaga frappieri]|uniref:Transmembrane protein n=1 Tax=Methylophaga frappieri (strain ATCC BAA-2434 / DSM 25690 / JAM7) TaxID=754477 RepID=I1YEM3_METFJ|nr:hypothetical protein [Methylophaga frappieri]AFJ01366.1 hypothetical protein Q7C_185 [Methylophaga frappieri]
MSLFAYLALLLALVGSVFIYLASKHQLWLESTWSPVWLRRGGWLLFTISLILLIAAMQTVAAIFVLMTWIMLMLFLFPYIGVWKSIRKTRR